MLLEVEMNEQLLMQLSRLFRAEFGDFPKEIIVDRLAGNPLAEDGGEPFEAAAIWFVIRHAFKGGVPNLVSNLSSTIPGICIPEVSGESGRATRGPHPRCGWSSLRSRNSKYPNNGSRGGATGSPHSVF